MKKILILLLILTLVLAQRGGGGGGRGGRGRRGGSLGSKRKRMYAHREFGCSTYGCPELRKNCDIECEQSFKINSKSRKECIQQCQDYYGKPYFFSQFLIWLIGLGLIIFGAINFVEVCILSYRKKMCRTKFINDHKQRTTDYQPSITDLEKQFQLAKKRLTKIHFFQDCRMYSTDSFKITGKPHKQRFLFNINFKSKDDLGSWTAEGLIGYSDQWCRIWFSKDYDNKKEAGQKGRWSTIIYEGKYSVCEKRFEGVWYFKGYENENSSYSGSWYSNTNKQE